jgi:hypothetical protein
MTEMAASAAASAAERFPPTANTCRPHTVLRAYRLTGGNSSETLLAGSSCGAYPTIDFAFGADVDTARWLIEKQESRTVQHGASQQDFLLVTAAQR